MDSHYRSKHWRLVWCGALFLTAGCSQAVLMEQESAQGGVVTYSYKQDRGITSTTVTSVPPSHTFGIVLVQFSDWSTNDDARGGKCLRHVQFDHYTWQQFRRAFFTQDSYITNPNGAQTHDLEAVFGSLRDYFNEASYNKYDVVKHPTKREILNDTTAAGIPIWITLTQTKAWWNAQPINPINLLNAAYQAAQAAGMPIDTVGYNKIAVIYAGKELAGGLNGAASGRVYQAGEKTPFKHGRTQTEGTFYGIGSHCHEYGHVIGMRDLYSRNDPDHRYGLGELSLMASGNQGFVNGNRSNSTKGGFHAPVHLDAWHKLQLGWAKHKVLSSGSYTFKSFEAEDTIAVHFINDANPTDWVEGAEVARLLETGVTHEYRLARPIPILMAYWTAEANEQGEPQYRPDIYRQDAALLAALNRAQRD